MNQNGAWFIREYESKNGVTEKTKFWMQLNPGIRSERRLNRAANKIDRSGSNAVHELGRWLNCNFKPGDPMIGTDYSPEGYRRLRRRANEMKRKLIERGEDVPKADDLMWMAANQETVNFIRRCQRECKKKDIPFRYAFITSDMDGDTGELVRLHHHLIVNPEAKEICLSKWTMGRTQNEPLWETIDYHPIAEYWIRQVRYIKNMKRYTPSRNLIRAEVGKPRPAKNGEAEIRPPKGAKLLHRSEYAPGKPQYIRYVVPEKTEKVTCRKEKAGAAGKTRGGG